MPHHQAEIDARLAVDLDMAQTLLRDFHRILGRPGFLEKLRD
jgi:hypothetical protein